MSITVLLLDVINTLLSIFPIILHVIGIYLLRQLNSLQCNQKLYLIHISIIEILYCIIQCILLNLKVFLTDVIYFQYTSFISHAVGFSWSNVLIMLTFDRFLHVYLNIKYQLYVTKKITKLIILFSYLLGICVVAILMLIKINLREKVELLRIYVYSTYGVLFISVFAVAYIYIYSKVRAARSSRRVQSTNHHQQSQHSASFVPFWIMFTFILFIVIPNAVSVALLHIFKVNQYDDIMYQVISLFWIIDFTTDALIYILFHESIKTKFLRLIGRRQEDVEGRGKRNTVEIPLEAISRT